VTTRVTTGDRVADELIEVTIQSPAQTRSASPGHRRETAQFTNAGRSRKAAARGPRRAGAAVSAQSTGRATDQKRPGVGDEVASGFEAAEEGQPCWPTWGIALALVCNCFGVAVPRRGPFRRRRHRPMIGLGAIPKEAPAVMARENITPTPLWRRS
jgi:hypothetical protein